MTRDEYEARLRAQLSTVEQQIESHKSALASLELEAGRIRYVLGEYVRSTPRMNV